MKHLTQDQYDDLVERAKDAEQRAAFMLGACRDAQALCAAAQERCRELGDETCGTGRLKVAFRAFEIADRAMFVDLESYGVKDESGELFTLVDPLDEHVDKVANARAELGDAIEWLQQRGYVKVDQRDGCDFVVVLQRPEDD